MSSTNILFLSFDMPAAAQRRGHRERRRRGQSARQRRTARWRGQMGTAAAAPTHGTAGPLATPAAERRGAPGALLQSRRARWPASRAAHSSRRSAPRRWRGRRSAAATCRGARGAHKGRSQEGRRAGGRAGACGTARRGTARAMCRPRRGGECPRQLPAAADALQGPPIPGSKGLRPPPHRRMVLLPLPVAPTMASVVAPGTANDTP